MTKPYTPKGKIVPLIQAVQADPDRILTVADAVKLMGVRSRCVGGAINYALRAEIIFRGKVRGQTVYRGKPFDAKEAMDPPPIPKTLDRIKGRNEWITTTADIRVPKVVPGWVPPKMVPPRGMSERTGP